MLNEKNDSYKSGSTFDPRTPNSFKGVTGQFHPRSEFQQSMHLVGRKHPHIFRNIAKLWGSQQLHDYLVFMMVDDSDNREALSIDTANAIISITLKHESDHKHIFVKSHDVLKSQFRKR